MFAAGSPFSLASAALGLGAVVALYALHHLRIQPTRRAVATLIFWRETVRKQQARKLWQRRFTHWRTFVLLSLITSVLAAALSADRWGSSGSDSVVVVDVGSSMAAVGADGRSVLQNVVDAARRNTGGLSSSPILVAAGPQPTVLCKAGEPLSVFLDRLSRLTPTAEASNPELAMELASSLLGAQSRTIDWYTDRSSLPDGVPSEIARQVRLRRQPSPPQAVSIVGAVFEPGGGRPSDGSLRVRLSGRCDRPMTLNATVGGQLRSQKLMPISGPVEVAIDGLAADGQAVTLNLPDAPGSPAEHSTRFELPRQFRPRIFLDGEIAAPLRAALDAVGTEASSPEGAIIVTRQGRTLPAGGIGSIVVVDAGPPSAARPVSASASVPVWLTSIDFEGATSTASQSVPVTATPLVVTDAVTAAGLEATASGPRLYLSAGLVAESADLPRHAAFPVLIERLVGELAGWHAGGPVVSARRIASDPLWPPARSTDPAATVVFDAPPSAVPDNAANMPPISDAAPHWPWGDLLLLSGFVLLTAEGLLLAGKKIV
jgi:hypothetical protein